MDGSLPKTSVAEILAHKIAALEPPRLPAPVRRKCEDLLIDVVGLCLTARNEDYVKAALAGWDEEGPCSAIGHARGMSAAGAAFVNGTAAHGEDFDDTFEGGPVHAGTVIVPAVLAACQRYHPDGPSAPSRSAPGGSAGSASLRPRRCTRPAFIPPPCSAPWRRPLASAPRSSLVPASLSTHSASSVPWPAASSNISRRAPGPSACIRAGRRNPGCGRRGSPARVSSARARYSKACTACSPALPTPPPATTMH